MKGRRRRRRAADSGGGGGAVAVAAEGSLRRDGRTDHASLHFLSAGVIYRESQPFLIPFHENGLIQTHF